ncbi:helix-turn-helix domain-containing protein [Kineococcus rhizosphaerae]|nr:helix-turn-helix transcriptional regulator [Kineococcus rhizosphaerae]
MSTPTSAPTSASADRRASRRELGAFLRARREGSDPVALGLPRTARRRTPGLRREELATLAGISATWYASLEQGRDVQPSDDVLAAVAEALRLDPVAREHLFTLAGGRTAPAAPEVLAPEVAAVPALLGPAPSYVTGRTTDVLAWNAAAAEFFPGFLDRADGTGRVPNLACWVFLDPAAREVLVEWIDVAQSVLARVRAAAGRHRGDAAFAALERELRTGSAEADAWWPRYDIAGSGAGTKELRHPVRGRISLSHASFTVAGAPEQVLVVYSPL